MAELLDLSTLNPNDDRKVVWPTTLASIPPLLDSAALEQIRENMEAESAARAEMLMEIDLIQPASNEAVLALGEHVGRLAREARATTRLTWVIAVLSLAALLVAILK